MGGTSPVIHGIRRTAARRGVEQHIVFSLEKGHVWVSWDGDDTPVHLGTEAEVVAMMEDFLAQVELGRRLNVRPQ